MQPETLVELPKKEKNQFGQIFYFSPESLLWKVNREQVLIFGGARALLMQLANPLIAEAVWQHSKVREDPVGRLNRTLGLMLKIIFGTPDEVLQAANTINMVHQRVKGVLTKGVGVYPAGTCYSATDQELLKWVGVTLFDTAATVYERFVQPLTLAEKQTLLQESADIAKLVGLREENFPKTPQELRSYLDQMIKDHKVVVSKKAKELAKVVLVQDPKVLEFVTSLSNRLIHDVLPERIKRHYEFFLAKVEKFAQSILAQNHPIFELATFPLTRLTAGLLPAKIRNQYQFSWGSVEEKMLDIFSQSVKGILPLLPKKIRFTPDYLRAKKILEEFQTTN